MAQFGHRFSAGDFPATHTDEFRGAHFEVRDLTGARFTDCDLTGVRVIDGFLTDVHLSGWVDGLTVNGVDVTGFVESELDKRHPERVQLRSLRSAADYRALWQRLETLWADLVVRVRRLPESAAYRQVDGEWSFVQTLRHLVFVTDAWASRTVLDIEQPYHSLGLPQTWYPVADALELGLDPAAAPSFDAVLDARADRVAVLGRIFDELTDEGLGRPCARVPAPGYPEEVRPVGECLWVVLEEECEHLRYAARDVAVLETAPGDDGEAAGGSR